MESTLSSGSDVDSSTTATTWTATSEAESGTTTTIISSSSSSTAGYKPVLLIGGIVSLLLILLLVLCLGCFWWTRRKQSQQSPPAQSTPPPIEVASKTAGKHSSMSVSAGKQQVSPSLEQSKVPSSLANSVLSATTNSLRQKAAEQPHHGLGHQGSKAAAAVHSFWNQDDGQKTATPTGMAAYNAGKLRPTTPLSDRETTVTRWSTRKLPRSSRRVGHSAASASSISKAVKKLKFAKSSTGDSGEFQAAAAVKSKVALVSSSKKGTAGGPSRRRSGSGSGKSKKKQKQKQQHPKKEKSNSGRSTRTSRSTSQATTSRRK
ncbi:hypothetical protein TYRP_011071 [Tyrophagus putrescentiae]|nr:hypothetical protein TYRP_011071 [Tyrophagus putrescentiae]